jgi:hypothetical protein
MKTAPRPFASVAQAVLVVWMLASMFLIGQQFSMQLYQAGLISLIVAALSQIAFGNIPSTANFGRSLRMYVWFMFIVAVIFGVSILMAPWLASLGR